MNIKKLGLYSCMIVLSVSLIGCSSKPKTTETTTTVKIETPKVEQPKEELIKISPLTIKIGYNNLSNEIMGTATNNNKMKCSFDIKVVYSKADGTLLTVETINVSDVKPGETVTFSDVVIDTDISKAKHKVEFGQFF